MGLQRFDGQGHGVVLSGDAHAGADRAIGALHLPQSIVHLNMAFAMGDGFVQRDLAANQRADALVENCLLYTSRCV